MDEEIVQVTVAVPSPEAGDQIARSAVERRLAACAQVLGPMTSTYWWEGKVETAEEWVTFLKTARPQVDALVVHVTETHPYEVPEVLVTPVAGGNPDYLRWVAEEATGVLDTALDEGDLVVDGTAVDDPVDGIGFEAGHAEPDVGGLGQQP